MKKLLFALLLLGIALRVIVFFQNRSLFLDEANLARNIIEKPIDQFFQPLDYEQYAPPFFLIIEKANTILFGHTEFAMRLFPLVMGILTLLFFYLLLIKNFDAPYWLWFPLFLLCFSPELIRYSSEIKQYMVDTGLVTFLIWLTLQLKPKSWNNKMALLWVAIGVTAVWVSMPIVFILSGIGLFYIFSFFSTKNFQNLLQVSLVIGSWLLSFGLFYWMILRPSLATNLLIDYHQTHFFPLVPTNSEEWTKAGKIILGLYRIPFGFTGLAYFCGISLFLTGIYALFQQNKSQLILLGIPILSCLLASGLGFYSLMPRLSLFLIPLLLLICSYGIEYLWRLNRNWIKYPLMLLFLAMIPQKEGYRFFYQKLEIEELKPIMVKMQMDQKSADLIYLHNEAAPAFLFYQLLHKKPITFPQSKVHPARWDETPADLLAKEEAPDRFWFVFSHLISAHASQMRQDNLEAISDQYILVDKVETKGAGAYLFESKIKKK